MQLPDMAWRAVALVNFSMASHQKLASVSSEPFVLLVGKVAFSALAVALIAWQGDFLMLAERAD